MKNNLNIYYTSIPIGINESIEPFHFDGFLLYFTDRYFSMNFRSNYILLINYFKQIDFYLEKKIIIRLTKKKVSIGNEFHMDVTSEK